MKKVLAIILFFALAVLFCYLTYKVWSIFGFWTIMWTGLVSIISSTTLGNLFGSKKELNGVVTFNPRELPKFLNILVSLVIGYYLFLQLDKPFLTLEDKYFGIGYLVLLTGLPIVYAIFVLIRDRNDFISISATEITYKDNKETGIIPVSTVKSVEKVKLGILIKDFSENEICIKTSQMNFNAIDLIGVLAEIKKRIPAPSIVEIEIEKASSPM